MLLTQHAKQFKSRQLEKTRSMALELFHLKLASKTAR